MRFETGEVFDRPTPWMLKAWQYRRSLGKRRSPGEVEAEAYVLDSRSAKLKYAMGDNRKRRLLGDVGLAQDRVLVPHWDNLERTQGIKPNAAGDLPGSSMFRLIRNSSGQYAKRSVPGRWGVYNGEINAGGTRLQGYIAGPPRVRAPITDAGTQKSVFVDRRLKANSPTKLINTDRPRILLIEIPHADYQPIMERPFESAVAEARWAIPDLMAAELAENIRHAGAKAAKVRLRTVLDHMEAAGARGEYDKAGRGLARSRALRTEASRVLETVKRGY